MDTGSPPSRQVLARLSPFRLTAAATVADPSPGAAITAAAPTATGFALLWDGEQWRLQYHRDGVLAADLPLRDVPTTGGQQHDPAGLGALAPDPDVKAGLEHRRAITDVPPEDWLQVEVAIEPRSAAAWIWQRGAPQPEQPNAVFAPPEPAAMDGARPRALFLPAHPVANVVLEGATRD